MIVSLLTISFAIQMLALLSVPVTPHIRLCTFGGYKFGVFGFCTANGKCLPIDIGYSNTTIEEISMFLLPLDTRRLILKLLVVHPISAGFTGTLVIMLVLVCFTRLLLARSVYYMFVLLLWTLPTFLLSLLLFLVDILLFAPHLDWCGWLILVLTVLIAVCGAMLCVVRRLKSSRMATEGNYKALNHSNVEGKSNDDEEYGELFLYDDEIEMASLDDGNRLRNA